ncbi:MAG: nucleotidyltransferase family protein [Cytophagales bacterium]|nr:nucleotidyltransferase family protein [Armatimonadota bacterium]
MNVWQSRPTPLQELLLKASLLHGDDSLRAWEAWISEADIDQLDGGSIRLLPLLYVHLKSQGVSAPQMPRFKGVYRHTWCQNQLLVRGVTPVLSALEVAGIPTLLLKGAALIHRYYPDYGQRPMGDFDLLVPVAEAWRAMEMLCARGWQPAHGEESFGKKLVANGREQAFLSPDKQRLDLHWHVLESFFDERGAEKSDAMFWGGAQLTLFHGVPTRVPNPADLLLHVCVHGAEGHPLMPPLRWAADGFHLLKTPGLEMDWDRLLRQAREHHLGLPLYDTLSYLSGALDAPVPPVVLQGLRSIPSSRRQRLRYILWTGPPAARAALMPPASALEALQSHRRTYAQWTAAQRGSGGNRGILVYLQDAWGLDSPGQVPPTILRRVLKKITATVVTAWNRRAVSKKPSTSV